MGSRPQPWFKLYESTDSDIPIPVYFTFAYYFFKDLTQLRTLKKNIPQPSQKNPQRKYKNKGSLTRKSSQLPKGTARRKTSPFGMLKFQCIFKNLHAIASSPTTLYIWRTRMERQPTAPQPTPRPHVLIPNSIRAHCHGLCGTAEAVTSFPPSFVTRKWLTHVFHVSIYQQIIRPVFWDLVTGPINCELPNNVYNQLLMALCYSMIAGPLVSVSSVPHLIRGFRETAHFHSWWFPHRWQVGGCLPKLPILDTWVSSPSLCDSYGKQAYGCLSYKGKQYAIWNDKTKSKSKEIGASHPQGSLSHSKITDTLGIILIFQVLLKTDLLNAIQHTNPL